MKIKYELKRYGRTVVFYVHDVDKIKTGYRTSNGFYIADNPSFTVLHNTRIDIVKDKECFLKFDTEQQAEEYIEKVHDALADWADNWEGWGQDKQEDETITLYWIKVGKGMVGENCNRCFFYLKGNCCEPEKIGKDCTCGFWTDKKITLTPRQDENGVYTL